MHWRRQWQQCCILPKQFVSCIVWQVFLVALYSRNISYVDFYVMHPLMQRSSAWAVLWIALDFGWVTSAASHLATLPSASWFQSAGRSRWKTSRPEPGPSTLQCSAVFRRQRSSEPGCRVSTFRKQLIYKASVKSNFTLCHQEWEISQAGTSQGLGSV